jgi:peptidoglycan/xylan/chitin deacetylase (PgdA/CDA1 family)
MHAAREGEAFDAESGLPRKVGQAVRQQRQWLELAREFIDARWDDFAPRHRKSTVDGLVTLTCALVRDDRTPPDAKVLRQALSRWAFNTGVRQREATSPEELREALGWIEANSLPLSAVGEADGVRVALRALATNLDGTRASASTVARKRAALSGALNYAVEKGYLSHNPLRDVRVKRRPVAGAIDPRVVVNPDQARDIGRDALFEVANHSYSHYAYTPGCYGLPQLPPGEFRADLERAAAAIRAAGVPEQVPYFRFPGGCYDEAALRALAPAGHTAVQWDVSSGDAFATDPGRVARTIVDGVRPGSVVVLHITRSAAPVTAAALRQAIPELRERGYEFVRVSELIGEAAG